MKKLISALIFSLLILSFIACQPRHELNHSDQSSTLIEGFQSLEASFMDYKFKVKKKGDSFLVQGKYDLNSSGDKEEIKLVLENYSDRGADSYKRVETYIEVDGIREEIYMSYSLDGEVRLINFDSNDKFIDLAIFDEGPSGDPHYQIYRYDGKEVYKLGDLDDQALANGQGKIIPSAYISDFQPAFVSAYLEIGDREFITKEKDIDQYLGKVYTLAASDNNSYFIPTDQVPENFSPDWENLRHFETTELRLIDIIYPYYDKRLLNFYFVELDNGEKGILYFWIGD